MLPHTHTHPFNGPLSGTTRVSLYQKGKSNLDFTEARDSEWQWHRLGYMQVCTSLQTDNHARTPPLSFFTCRMPFLPPNLQRQCTEGQFQHASNGSCWQQLNSVHYCASSNAHAANGSLILLTTHNYVNEIEHIVSNVEDVLLSDYLHHMLTLESV